MSSPSDATPAAPRRRRGLPPATVPFLAGILTGLLALEFLLGMALNLYMTIPSGGVGALSLAGRTVLVLHIIVGILVVTTALRMTILAAKAHNGRRTALSAIALVGMVLAFLAGADFAFSGPNDASSFTIAFGFFLGMFCSALIVAGIHFTHPEAESGAA